MRVLHIFDHSLPHQSGYVFRSLNIIRVQREMGWQTFHLTSPKQGPVNAPVETIDGYGFFRTTTATRQTMPVADELRLMRALWRRLDALIDELRPDLLHAHSPLLNGYPALLAARRHGIPLIYEIRAFWEDAAADQGTSVEGGPRYRATRALETWLMRRADHLITICEGLRNDILARGIAPERVTVIPNFVDPEAFAAARTPEPELVRDLGLRGRTVLGFIGSFYKYEGLAFLVETMPRLLGEMPDLCLLLVGGGEEDERLRRLIAEKGLANDVIMTGRVPHTDVKKYYDLVDIFVYPRISRRLTELVTPLKPIEAMAAGRTVVASNVGGHREIIEHGQNGFLFEAGSPESLQQTLIRALTSATLDHVAANAVSHVERHHSIHSTQSIYEPFSKSSLDRSTNPRLPLGRVADGDAVAKKVH